MRPIYNPCPLNLRLPKPDEHTALLVALHNEHKDQLKSDTTGNVAKVRIILPVEVKAPPLIMTDNLSESDLQTMDVVASTTSVTTPDEFCKRNVVLKELQH